MQATERSTRKREEYETHTRMYQLIVSLVVHVWHVREGEDGGGGGESGGGQDEQTHHTSAFPRVQLCWIESDGGRGRGDVERGEDIATTKPRAVRRLKPIRSFCIGA